MKKLVRILLPLLILTALCLSSCAQDDISPTSDFYVYDEANVLSEETCSYIIEKNRRLCSLTGAQIVVMCVPTTGDQEIDDFATRIFNTWGIGDEKKDNGVLLLLSIEEDDYWVLQGQGLEEILSSGILKLMLNTHMEPHFAAKEYDAGVRATFDALLSHLESAYSITIAEGESAAAAESEEMQTAPFYIPEQKPSGIGYAVNRFVRMLITFAMGIFSGVPIVLIIIVIVIFAVSSKAGRRRRTPPPPNSNRNPFSSATRVRYRPGPGPGGFTPPPPPGGFHRPSGGFGGPRPSGGSRPSGGFGGSRSSGGGSRGGGGHSRGGGAGRR